MASIVVGLLLASIVVLILDAFERPVRETGDSSLIGLPVIARIPAFSTKNRRALPWIQSMTLEAFLQLCISLKLKNTRPIRTLAITSPTRGDGKSTVAFNLAKAMANLQQRVLLIDGDLRKPVLHTFAGCGNNIGLSDVLQNACTFSQAIHEISPAFHLLPAGPCVENPVALMQLLSFDALLNDPLARYSVIIIDTPALSAVTEGFLISAKVDATALVIAANETNERDTKEVVARYAALGVDNLVGVVLNKDSKRFSDYGDYFSRSSQAALPTGSP
jgi:capsular exopolysaccharide synthesis family protein